MAPVADRTEGANIGSLTDGSVGRARRGHKKAGGEEGEEEKEEEEGEGSGPCVRSVARSAEKLLGRFSGPVVVGPRNES